jgi:AbiU2
MPGLAIVLPAKPEDDIVIFASHCVFVWSIYLHAKMLFEASSDNDKKRMSRTAGILFGDLNRMFNEYLILQVCKITDPAKDMKKNDNHTVTFLLQHYDFSVDPAAQRRLKLLADQLHAFRKQVEAARNKFISHSDRTAILAGAALGAAPQAAWDGFWSDLQAFVSIIHEKVVGTPFEITEVGMASDADGLLKALTHAACFEELMADSALTHRCVDVALAKG